MTSTEKICYAELTETVSEYKWTLYNFSSLNHPTGRCIKSQIFLCNGLKWNIQLYPNGDCEGSKEYISLFIGLLSNVKVIVAFDFIMSSGTKVLNVQKTSNFIIPFDFLSGGYGVRKFIDRNTVLANLKETNDILTIVVKIYFSSVSQETNYLNLQEDFGLLLKTGENFDINLVSSDNCEHKAHKAILACRSKVFSAMFQHNMKENQDNVVNIEDVDNETLEAMLHFVYKGELVPLMKNVSKKLLIAADKYELNELKSMCIDYLHANINDSNVMDLIKTADTYNISELKLKAKKYFLQNHKEILTTERRVNLKELPRDIVEDLLCDLSSDLSFK